LRRLNISDSLEDAEVSAEEVSVLGHRLDELEKRLAAVEKVNVRLEEAALTTARSRRFRVIEEAVYEAMHREDESQEALGGDCPLAPGQPERQWLFDPRYVDPCVCEGSCIRVGVYLLLRPRKDSP